jgi:homoserine kinase type II
MISPHSLAGEGGRSPAGRRLLPEFPGAAIERLYGIEATPVAYLSGGDEADTWRVRDSSDSSWCVKSFRRLRPGDAHARLELMNGLSGERFPFPHVRRTRGGGLVGSWNDRAVTVSGWIDGAPVDVLTTQTGAAAGWLLARLHAALRRDAQPGLASRKSWEVDQPEQAIDMCRTARARIQALRTASELDWLIHDALGERIDALSRIDEIRCAMPHLTRQRLHCDYTRPNLLFARGSLVGVLDLLGHIGYPAWELGRLAFEPLTVARRADWPQVALAILAAYRSETTVTGSELRAAVRTTLLYNLFSFWGISGRYPATGAVTATGNEDYWLSRQKVARLLLVNLSDIEALVSSLA